jgi:hypothetical protein
LAHVHHAQAGGFARLAQAASDARLREILS